MATWLTKPKEGHGLANWEVDALKSELADWKKNLEDVVLTCNSIRDRLVIESLRRLLSEKAKTTISGRLWTPSCRRIVADGGCACEDVMRNVYGFCIYDDDEDPCHDNCLFCHHPEERK